MSDPLPWLTLSTVTDGTTTTDSPSWLRRMARQTSGIRVWSAANRRSRSSGASSARVGGRVAVTS
ncbi:MAG TPA: hypothetical protein VG035_07410 [Actinomycetota bacterium]|nr:hypothetical protein [Actinomycetota bacterium]